LEFRLQAVLPRIGPAEGGTPSNEKMSPKEIAAHYEARVFDSPAAAESAGFALTETLSPRNVWNKASAAQSIALKLREKKEKGEAKEIGLVIEPWSVTGCYVPNEAKQTTS
jgi:hypothetical protein